MVIHVSNRSLGISQVRTELLWTDIVEYLPVISLLYTEMAYVVEIFHMMTPSNGNIFRVTGHLCGEFTSHRWIPHTKASDAELWCFLWSVSEWTVE